jgi:RNA polymerase sigma-70 factor (ECF subfamily)
VESAEPAKDVHRELRARTLGDLLYAPGARPAMHEDDWLALVKSIAAGDQFALHSLYERTHRIVFTLIVRITNNREVAEEVTLDVFHDVWRRASAYDPANGSVVGWIMNQAWSRAIDRIRFAQRKKRVNNDTNGVAAGRTSEDPHAAFDVKEQGSLLREAMNNLNHDEKQAIEMAYFSELTHQEVAGSLNEPLGTIKSRIRSGLNKLRSVFGTGAESL